MASGLDGERKRSIASGVGRGGEAVSGEGGRERKGFAFIDGEIDSEVVKQTCDRIVGRAFRPVTQALGADIITQDDADSTMSLFTPDDPYTTSRLFRFLREVNEKHGLGLESYEDLYQWSVSNIDLFWSHVWDHTKIIGYKGDHVVSAIATPTENPVWFSGSAVNFAENLLSNRSPDTTAVVQVCTLHTPIRRLGPLAMNFACSGTNFPESQARAPPNLQRPALLARGRCRVRPSPEWTRSR